MGRAVICQPGPVWLGGVGGWEQAILRPAAGANSQKLPMMAEDLKVRDGLDPLRRFTRDGRWE
jgi:hypothetical protein